MPDFADAGLIGIIDDRVRRALKRPLRVGTFAERTGTVYGKIVEDGTTTAMSCLVANDITLMTGDRVLFAQFGSDWVIVGSLTPQGVELQYEYTAGGETTSSSSYVDAPGLPAVDSRTWSKFRPNSHVMASVDATQFATANNTEAQWGVLLTDINVGTTYGPTLVAAWFPGDSANRSAISRKVKIADVPVGTYDVKLQWRRSQGAGTITMNGDDRYTFNVREAILQG